MSFELKKEYRMFIGGEWREASDGQWLQTFNPATGEVLSQIPQATNDDVDDAVEAAKKSF